MRLVLLGLFCQLARSLAQSPHWHQTPSETIWTDRYSNCDHGYYVLLPSGVVGHDSLPPSPNNGFQVELSDPSTTSPANPHSVSAIWVWDSPGFEEPGSTTLKKSPSIRTKEPDRPSNAKFLRRTFVRVDGEKAVYIRSSLQDHGAELLEDDVVVFSPDAQTEYQFRLTTPNSQYAKNKRMFDEVLKGFHFTTVPPGECSND